MLANPAHAQQSPPEKVRLEDRFYLINQHRLRRMLDNLTPRQRDLVELIPLLFHLNHPLLPGYTTKSVPAGICDFSPSEGATKAARRIAKAFSYEHRLQRVFPIKGLFLMGSPGTIAYSKHSDLDMWLCHDPGLDAEDIKQLTNKAEKIQGYADKVGLEVHFFVFSAEDFRDGETLSLSDESSGSSQHALLLDEFYRSGLLLAGLRPLWWCVPADQEHRYDDYVCELRATEQTVERDYLDFGGLAGVPAKEFFGAAIWQLYKSIDSPYKSVLKLLLMESYATEFPRISLLSYRYKNAVTAGVVALNDIDPYILMYRKVEEYLMAANDKERLELMRRCFYLKVNIQLSTQSRASLDGDWQNELLTELTNGWDWSEEDIEYLDNRRNWKIRAATHERRGIIKVLQKSYVALSNFARSCGEDQSITGHDLNVLGRKLYAAFERKPSKIEIVTRGICSYPMESDLSLRQRLDENGNEYWSLYTGTIRLENTNETRPIKSGKSLAGVLAWCHFNHLYNHATNWHIVSTDVKFELPDLRRTLNAIERCYPNGEIVPASTASLAKNTAPLKTLLLLNVGRDTLGGRLNDGVLTTSSNDAFRYGGQNINLISSAALLIMTTWEEVHEFSFVGPFSVQEAVAEYLHWALRAKRVSNEAIRVFCGCRDYAQPIQRRVEQYISEVFRFVESPRRPHISRYVTQLEHSYCTINLTGDKPKTEKHGSYHSLLKYLGTPNETCPAVCFDSASEDVRLLRELYTTARADEISIFVQQKTSKADIYIIDERGSLFVQRQALYRVDLLFDHFGQFLRNVLNRSNDIPEVSDLPAPTVFRQFTIGELRDSTPTARAYTPPTGKSTTYIGVKVFVDLDQQDNQILTMLVGESEFSTTTLGAQLFNKIVKAIVSKRQKSEDYPIHINDLEFSHRYQAERDIAELQTVHLLNFKKRIEYQLTRALAGIEGA